MLLDRMEAKGHGRWPTQGSVNKHKEAWLDAACRMLAWTKQEHIDASLYIDSVVETVGWHSHHNRFPMKPGSLCGKNAAERYNKWLARQRAQGGRGDLVSKKQDKQLEYERVYVQTYAASTLPPGPRLLNAHQLSLQQARLLDPSYNPSRNHRLIALNEYLHEIHPGITSRILLRPGWTLKGLFKVLRVVLAP